MNHLAKSGVFIKSSGFTGRYLRGLSWESSREKDRRRDGPLTSVTLRKPEKSATTFPWVSMTPFGFPVQADRKHTHTHQHHPSETPLTCPRITQSSKGKKTKGIWHGKTNLGFARNSPECYSQVLSCNMFLWLLNSVQSGVQRDTVGYWLMVGGATYII